MSPLVDVDDLVERVRSTRPPTLLDVRWSVAGPPGRIAYETGHLPGAHFVDVDVDLAELPAPNGIGGRHPLPAPDVFGAAMRRCGVRTDRPVVVYDQADSTSAVRAWWLLRHGRHPDVAVLDGGYDAWVAAGHPTVTGPEPSTPAGDQPPRAEVRPEPGTFEPVYGAMPVVDADGAAVLARDGVLLDARSAIRFRGEQEPIDPVAGHIPGAISAPALENVEAGGRFRAADDLRDRFAALGADGSVPVGAYCGSGVVAAHEILALELAGIPAALYAGSWSDWITDPSRPIQNDHHS